MIVGLMGTLLLTVLIAAAAPLAAAEGCGAFPPRINAAPSPGTQGSPDGTSGDIPEDPGFYGLVWQTR